MPDKKRSFQDWIDSHFGTSTEEERIITARKRVAEAYHAVMKTEEGEMVLYDILNHCGFMGYNEATMEDLVRLNVAKFILKRMGKWTEGNAQRIIMAINRLPIDI